VALKSKEIAIRKVMGATVQSIITAFSRKYLLLVGVAGIPAIVLSWYGMNMWLEDFAYRITIGADIYLLTILLVILIAFATIAWHALKAGRTNPVDYLREQ
jgi:putative ABC transport system permease protein